MRLRFGCIHDVVRPVRQQPARRGFPLRLRRGFHGGSGDFAHAETRLFVVRLSLGWQGAHRGFGGRNHRRRRDRRSRSAAHPGIRMARLLCGDIAYRAVRNCGYRASCQRRTQKIRAAPFRPRRWRGYRALPHGRACRASARKHGREGHSSAQDARYLEDGHHHDSHPSLHLHEHHFHGDHHDGGGLHAGGGGPIARRRRQEASCGLR